MKTREAELGGSGGATQIDSRGQKKSPQQQKKFAADTAKKTSQSKASTNKAIVRNENIARDVQIYQVMPRCIKRCPEMDRDVHRCPEIFTELRDVSKVMYDHLRYF